LKVIPISRNISELIYFGKKETHQESTVRCYTMIQMVSTEIGYCNQINWGTFLMQ